MRKTSKGMFVAGAVILSVCLFGLLLPGCRRNEETLQWAYTFEDIDGNAALDTEQFTLIQQGISYGGGISKGEIQVAGNSFSSGKIDFKNGFVFSNSYGNGVCSITFGKADVKIINRGRTMIVNDKKYRLGEEKLVLMFNKEGKVVEKEDL